MTAWSRADNDEATWPQPPDRECAAARHRPGRAGRVRRRAGECVGGAHRGCRTPADRGQRTDRHRRGGCDAARRRQGACSASDRDVPLGVWDAAAAPAHPRTARRFHPSGPCQRTTDRTSTGTRYRFRLMATTCGHCRRGTARSSVRTFTTRSARPPAARTPPAPPGDAPAPSPPPIMTPTYDNPVAGSVADPTVLDAGDGGHGYYLYATGTLFPIWRSPDLVHWTNVGTAFTERPAWTVQSGDWHPWAPGSSAGPRRARARRRRRASSSTTRRSTAA
jgi:hypothetical protein